MSRAFPTTIAVRVTLPNRVQKFDLIKLRNGHERREHDDNRGAARKGIAPFFHKGGKPALISPRSGREAHSGGDRSRREGRLSVHVAARVPCTSFLTEGSQ